MAALVNCAGSTFTHFANTLGDFVWISKPVVVRQFFSSCVFIAAINAFFSLLRMARISVQAVIR